MKKLALVVALALMAVAFTSSANALVWATGPADIFLAGGLAVNTDGPNGAQLSSLTDPFGGTINITPVVERYYIGQGWATWSHGYTGSILANFNSSSIRLDFDGTVTAFGGYAEPNIFDNFSMTLGLADGSSLTKMVQGQAGAEFFGFYDGAVNWVQFDVDPNAGGLAIGELAMAKVPEPGTLMLLGSGLLGLGLLRRRK